MHLHTAAALLLLALPAFAQVPKDVAAPPADVLAGVVRLPAPEAGATRSSAAIEPLLFARGRDGAWRAEVEVRVDARGPLAVALLSDDAGAWELEARDARGAWRSFAELASAERTVQPLDVERSAAAVARWDVAEALPGALALRVVARGERAPAEGWLLARGAAELVLTAWVSTPVLVADEPIHVLARLAGPGARGVTALERARVVLATQRGTVELALADDGAHGDGAADDGLFGADVPRGVAGELRARVDVVGTLASGAPFTRSSVLAFPVLERRFVLDGAARASELDSLRLEVALGAFALDAGGGRAHVSAEVWGRSADGNALPVCWLSRQCTPRAAGDRVELALALDRRWVELADARAPFELRAVRVQDPDTEVVYDRLDSLALALPELAPRAGGPARELAAEMLTGGPSTLLAPPPGTQPAGPHAPSTPSSNERALMLVHGYCSSGSIWPAADFTAPKVEFLDPNQNRSHDAFAQLLAQRAAQANLGSFGVVAHSQGGCAALHLITYYTSGLDSAVGARRIQSVATPYQGTPLASLGSFACGVNSDMTPSGSATWLAGIPSWARNEVWYWTTSNSGSACNFLTDFFLTNPEDGTVEQSRGQLTGAHSMGHVTGWCHTTGMSNPANYTDHTRNQAMNAAAAR